MWQTTFLVLNVCKKAIAHLIYRSGLQIMPSCLLNFLVHLLRVLYVLPSFILLVPFARYYEITIREKNVAFLKVKSKSKKVSNIVFKHTSRCFSLFYLNPQILRYAVSAVVNYRLKIMHLKLYVECISWKESRASTTIRTFWDIPCMAESYRLVYNVCQNFVRAHSI